MKTKAQQITITFEATSIDGEIYVLIPKDDWEVLSFQYEGGHYILRRRDKAHDGGVPMESP